MKRRPRALDPEVGRRLFLPHAVCDREAEAEAPVVTLAAPVGRLEAAVRL